jgi:sarcosine oxidase, subunit gamma
MSDMINWPTKSLEKIETETVILEGLRPMGQLNIRGKRTIILPVIEKITENSLPEKPNTFIKSDFNTMCWLGPDEWLLLCDFTKAFSMERKLREALDQTHSAIIDVSHNRSLLKISGEKAAYVLSKGCSINLDETVFTPGTVLQTLLGKTQVILSCTEKNSFELLIRNSFIAYAYEYLSTAMSEFQ